MLSDFRSYKVAVELYKISKTQRLNSKLKDQLLRASSSVALNLAEGNDRSSEADRRRFFVMAFTSLREVQAIVELEDLKSLQPISDKLGAMIYRLLHPIQN